MIKLRNRGIQLKALYYALLTVVMFLAFFAANYFGIVNMTSQLSPAKWVLLFFWYMAFLWMGDRLIKRVILIK